MVSYDALVIMVNYNSKEILPLEFQLLRNLSREKKEIVLALVDDASEDGSFEKLLEYAKKLNINFIKIKIPIVSAILAFLLSFDC